MALPSAFAGVLVNDSSLWSDFTAICDCGGRVAGTASERSALDLVARLGAAATGSRADVTPVPYDGWTCRSASLELIEADKRVPLDCVALLKSRAGSVEAEVLPVGRGTEAEFVAAADRLKGRIALVCHEYMFAAGHVHRREKYAWAHQYGAVGFLIAGPLARSPVAGGAGPELLALGISPEAAARLSSTRGRLNWASLSVDADHVLAKTETLRFVMAGRSPERVVLSAHVDGHSLAESAIDNATGVAVALAVARCLAPHVHIARRGLDLMFFSAEEWALTGSEVWLGGLSQAERANIAVNINLDSVGGGRELTALTSGFPGLEPLVRQATAPIGIHVPLVNNSDHANFAAHGIPALRLVADFNNPASELRHVLTAADTRDKVTRTDLLTAALATAELVWTAMNAPQDEVAGWRYKPD